MAADLVPIAGGCAFAALAVYAKYLFSRERYKRRLLNEWLDLSDRIDDFAERLHLIETHAIDYSTSMSGSGTRALFEVRTLLECALNLKQFIRDFIDTDDYTGLNMAERLLKGDFPSVEERSKPTIEMVTTQHIPDSPEWESRVEELLQIIGQDISIASKLKDSLQHGKRKRRGTMEHLELARIFLQRGDT